MVIECKGCLKKFKLDEKRLKPQGSRVRCSNCREIFLAFPTESGGPRKSAAGIDREGGIFDQGENATAGFEKREYPRITVSIPASCNNLDWDGKPLDLQIGVIKEVSPAGVAIELFSGSVSEVVSVSFIGDENREVQIRGRVEHSDAKSAGKVKLSLSLLGSPGEIYHFVMQAMRTHHQSDMELRQIRDGQEGAPSEDI